MQVHLPAFLKPFQCETLIRVGNSNDGGYVIDARNIESTQYLLSFGICDDWTFEKQFISKHNIPLSAYDASVSKKYFKKMYFKSFLRFSKPELSKKRRTTYKDYLSFFNSTNRRHIEKFVGYDNGSNFVSLKTILETNQEAKNKKLFLKIDVEGWEYRILDDLIKYGHQIEGLAIEFHDIDIHFERIKAFINNFSLQLIHVHCNNSSAVINGYPTAIECTFSKLEAADKITYNLPSNFDSPNTPIKEDYSISFQSS